MQDPFGGLFLCLNTSVELRWSRVRTCSGRSTVRVRRGYIIHPNALLNFKKDTRDKRSQEMHQYAIDLGQKQPKQEIREPKRIIVR